MRVCSQHPFVIGIGRTPDDSLSLTLEHDDSIGSKTQVILTKSPSILMLFSNYQKSVNDALTQIHRFPYAHSLLCR